MSTKKVITLADPRSAKIIDWQFTAGMCVADEANIETLAKFFDITYQDYKITDFDDAVAAATVALEEPASALHAAPTIGVSTSETYAAKLGNK